MRAYDLIGFSLRAITRYRARSALMLLAMAIGVAAVVVLTSLGEAARRYVSAEFASLGTHLLIVFPGRSDTAGGGGMPGMFSGETPRDLTLDDALALTRERGVRRIAPLVLGSAPVSFGPLDREVPIIGSTAELADIRHWKVAQGSFLPPGDPRSAANVCVIGAKVRREIFGSTPPLGEWIRIGDRRFRVIGVLSNEGRSIGLDVEEIVIIPVAAAQSLLDAPSLLRIFVETWTRDGLGSVSRGVTETLRHRHQGEEDVTVVSQDALLATFDRVLRALTYTVGGIAAISLVVAGVLIMNVMLVAVSQRTAEIGLLKALGAPSGQILALFLVEATLLSILGASLGAILGELGSRGIGRLYPVLPVGAPWWAFAASLGTALVTGLAFGVIPARRAARLDPVDALARR